MKTELRRLRALLETANAYGANENAARLKAEGERDALRHRCAWLTGTLVNMVESFENDHATEYRAAAILEAKTLLIGAKHDNARAGEA